MAESQTYSGWLRLADGAGWMMFSDPDLGELLEPVFLQQQRKNYALKEEVEARLEEAAVATLDSSGSRPPMAASRPHRHRKAARSDA